MAYSIFRRSFSLSTVNASLYTIPPGKYLEITSSQVTNVDQTQPEPVPVEVTILAAGPNLGFSFVSRANVAGRDALSPMAGGVMLVAGDEIQGSASNAADATLFICGYLKDLP